MHAILPGVVRRVGSYLNGQVLRLSILLPDHITSSSFALPNMQLLVLFITFIAALSLTSAQDTDLLAVEAAFNNAGVNFFEQRRRIDAILRRRMLQIPSDLKITFLPSILLDVLYPEVTITAGQSAQVQRMSG